ncbi:MAG: sensor histidine kinase [Deltaproteobacteria bacterium]|nr:sensor histidine kinase [Deltaproteobacteria bacterium]
MIVGFSATLLLISTSGMLQIALFGLLIMNMSDIAMRYQSVYQNISGMIVFEHGWFFGLALVASGVLLAARSTNAEVRSKLRQVLCFYSIRSMTIGFVLLGLGLIWLALGTYFRAIHLPNEVSASLLIAVSVFAFAVLAANVVSQNLSQIVFRLASNKSVSRQDFPKHLPEEIRTIVEYFQMLSGKLTGERDHALKLSSTIAHNIKSPAGALEMARFKINRHINKGCECCKQLQEPLRLIGVSAEAIKNISDRILEEKKRLIALETVADSVSNAVAITTANHPDHQIFIEVAPESQLVPVIGLSEILTNLIDNAVEASLPTQPIIVRTRLEGTGMTVMVVDHGCGIPDWMLAELKKGEERTSKGRGNGIGVSSMYAWAKERGYEITIDSSTATPATGTRVAISIPASLSPEVLEPTVTTQENVAIWT